MEWLASDGFDSRIINGDKITLNHSNIKLASESFERAGRWIKSKLTSTSVLDDNELSVENKFINGKVVFVRLWNGNYARLLKKSVGKNGWEIGISYLPKGKKSKAATVGGWGLSISEFSSEKKNMCRKNTSVQALHIL